MNSLTRNQYIGVATALIVAGFMFYGISYVYSIISSKQNMTDPNQIQSQVSAEGNATSTVAAKGDRITVNYTGTFANGTKFDSSYDRGVPFTFTLGVGQVIAGWDQGLIGTKEGEKLTLTIPPALGYGDSGVPDGHGGFFIPPGSTLVFQVEVLKIQK